MKVLLLILSAILTCHALAQSPRVEENFDNGWLFSRFGLQADGSRLAEPGKSYPYSVIASSEELGLANAPQSAMDGNAETCWQPAETDVQPWVMVDLGIKKFIQDCKIKSSDEVNIIAIEGSNDKQSWGKLSGEFRFVRITFNKPKEKILQVNEIVLSDRNGKAIINSPVYSTTPEKNRFNDSGWRKLNLPHDWGIEGPFRIDLDGNTGKLPWRGIGWYRKHFFLASAKKGKQFYLDFDGAMANAEVWLNGHKVGERPYGYSSFRVDLTPFILFNKENVIAVRLNTEKLGSRWYPGAGIYRHVRMVKTDPVHVAQWGVFVTTPEISDAVGKIEVSVAIMNNLPKPVQTKVAIEIYELGKNGVIGKRTGMSEKQPLLIPSAQTDTELLKMQIANPKRWDLENTNRYLARVSVFVGTKLVNVYDAPFGFRTIQFTHENGFLLNGKRVQIQGTCNHHDLGALGTAVNTCALERQLSILKDMGCNALRTSHNPPSPELLTLADKMGFLVMDEAFDCWEEGKTPNDYSVHFKQWHQKDLEMLVCRDRNHPSVILWSTGNEVPEQYTPEKGIAQRLTDIIHRYDTSRPVTFGASWPSKSAFNGTELQVDVHGMNYASGNAYGGPDLYGKFLNLKGHEHLAGYGSETSSTMSSRGEYFKKQFQVSSYDLVGPGWGSLPDAEFTALDKYPAICGEFVWTGFDYLGEPTPFNSDATLLLNHAALTKEQLEKEKEKLDEIAKSRPPSRSSYFGMVDIAGFPKDRFYLYQSRWRPDYPMVHILPHWNFPDRINKVTPVFVYTSGDEAELFLNGKSLGRKKKLPFEYRIRWDDVVYEPGELKAVAYKNQKEWASAIVKTTGAPVKLKLKIDKPSVHPDGKDLIFVTISVTDSEGNMIPDACNLIKCRLKGDGEIIATDNGDATCLVTYSCPVRNAFNGLLLAIVKAKPGAKGNIRLIAESDGLETGVAEIGVK